jgi:bacterial/archaeal transporter family protein
MHSSVVRTTNIRGARTDRDCIEARELLPSVETTIGGRPGREAMTSSWIFWAMLSATFAALTSILAKTAVGKIESDYATFLRTVVIVTLLFGYILVANRWQNPLKLPPASVGILALSGLATCISWLCYFRALKLGQASKVDPIDKSSVVLVAVFAFLFLHERLSALQWVGVLLAGAGVALLAFKPDGS